MVPVRECVFVSPGCMPRFEYAQTPFEFASRAKCTLLSFRLTHANQLTTLHGYRRRRSCTMHIRHLAFESKYSLPVVFHADDVPAAFVRSFVQRLAACADFG